MAIRKKIRAVNFLRIGSSIVLLALCAGLTGCASSDSDDLFEKKGPSEVGATNLAITSVTRWKDVASDLQPSFNLTEDEALTEVNPAAVVEAQAENDTSSLKIAGQALSPIPSSEAKTTPAPAPAPESSDEAKQTVIVRTSPSGGGAGRGSAGGGPRRTTGGGAPSPGETATSSARASVPGASAAPNGATDIEPQLRYTLATALLQYVRLTNHYVNDLVGQEGNEAYVVRLQISLMPLSREAQYDTYTDVAFFGQDAQGHASPVQVVPLLATDSLEGLMQSQSSSNTRDIALSLQALMASGSAGISAEKLSQTLKAVAGEDKNSLFTMGRVTDNTVRVRLGAFAQPTGEFVMVPRTCTVPVVLLVPRHPNQGIETDIQAVSKTVFVNAISGKLIHGRTHWRSLVDMPPIHDSYNILKPPYYDPPNYDYLGTLTTLAIMGKVTEFANYVQTLDASPHSKAGDYGPLATHPAGDPSMETAHIGELWMEALSLRSTDAVQTMRFRLPRIEASKAPPDQSATLVDDGDTATVELHGGSQLQRLTMQGVLELNQGAKTGGMRLFAYDAPKVSLDGEDVSFFFPSLKASGMSIPAGFVDPATAVLRVTSVDPESATAPDASPSPATTYNLVIVNPATQPVSETPPQPLIVVPDTIEADDTTGATAQVNVQIKPVIGSRGPYRFVVTGGNATPVGTQQVLVQNGSDWLIAGPGLCTLKLANFSTASQLAFDVYDSTGKQVEHHPARIVPRGTGAKPTTPANGKPARGAGSGNPPEPTNAGSGGKKQEQ